MKKFLPILFFLQILASGKDVRIFLNSNVDANISFRTRPITSKALYTPIDLTVASRDNKFSANFVLKGRVHDEEKLNVINTPINYLFDVKNIDIDYDKFLIDSTITANPSDILNPIVKEAISDVDTTLKIDTTLDKTNLFLQKELNYYFNDNIYSNALDFNTEEHNHGHSHTHNHNHNHNHSEHEHEHEHSFKRETFKTLNPRYFTTKTNSSLAQAKIDLKYFNGKNGIRYIQYLTPFEEEDGVKQKDDAILELRNINVFKDKFSIAFTPRIYTRNFIKPLYFDIDFDARYKKDENTTLGLFYYTAAQLDDLKHFKNTKNKVSVYYDFKEDYKKFHKFYEILDHEHESKNRFRILASFNNEKQKSNGFFNISKEKKEQTLEVNIKKSDFLIKNLSIKNDFKIHHESQTTKDFSSNYSVFITRKFDKDSLYIYNINSDDHPLLTEKSNFSFFDTEEKKYITKDENSFTFYKITNATPNQDIQGIEPISYLDIIKIKRNDAATPKITNSSILGITNNTNISYLTKKATISLDNDISFIKDLKYSSKYVFKDKLSLSYKTEESNNLLLDLKVSNEYALTSKNKLEKYSINTLTFDGTLGYTFRFQEFDVTPYTGIKHDIQFRRVNNESLLAENNKDELNKTVIGHLINFKHGVKAKFDLTNNLSLTGDANVMYFYDKQSNKNALGIFKKLADTFTKFKPVLSIKFGLKYVY